MHHLILVPVDFTDAATDTLSVAANVARELEADLRLIHVVDPASAVGGSEDHLAEVAWSELGRYVVRPELGGLGVTTQVAFGEAAERISRVAQDLEVEMIIMGDAPSSEAAERVRQLVPCPLLTVHRQDERVVSTLRLSPTVH